MLNSFNELLDFLNEHSLIKKFETRIKKIVNETIDQHWVNASAFESKSDIYL